VKLHKDNAEIWVPDGTPVDKALARTTHMGISAHQDDIEIMAMEGVLKAFGQPDLWFTGVVVTDGAGSDRIGIYKDYTNEEMCAIRRIEQKKAAFVGEYSAIALLDHSSKEVRDSANNKPVEDLAALVAACSPEVVYMHNLADKHPTHIATALRTIKAIRSLPKDKRPKKVYGCEVWRDLDWMIDDDKKPMVLDSHENIATSLVGLFDSQVIGGKRYDLATIGRRRAHATYFESHKADNHTMINFGMNLTPLIEDDSLDITEYVLGFIKRFSDEVEGNLKKLA
jgi:LmbE family N-acetylglucosaminyl deacetylase